MIKICPKTQVACRTNGCGDKCYKIDTLDTTITKCKESWSREELIWHIYNVTNELGNGSIKSTDVKKYNMESLEEKFQEVLFNSQNENTTPYAQQCVQIAEEFALGFKKFCDKQLSVRTDIEYLELYKQHLKDNGKSRDI